MQIKRSREDILQAKTVLGVAAHADDLDFTAAGTIAKMAANGAEVYYLILTDGSKGSADIFAGNQDLAKRRRDEQCDAAKALGVKEVFFLGYEDGRLEVTMELKRDIVRYIRRLQPQVVIAFDPSMFYDAEQGIINHPDHRACGQATLDAVYPLARDHLSLPELFNDEGLEPHKVTTVLLSNFERHNYSVEINDMLDKKLQAIACHVSQVADTAEILTRFTERAVRAGEPDGYSYAEQFVRIDVWP